MALKDRRTGARSWARGIFAFCWIVLAGVSGLYLFTLFTDPAALGGQTVQLSSVVGDAAPAVAAPAADAPAPPPVAAMAANDLPSAAELASLKSSLQGISQQLAQLDARLKPIEKFVGPVAALPPAASVTTSPPAPQAAPVSEADVAAPAPAAPEPAPAEDVVEEVVEEEVEVAEAEVETPAPPAPQAAASPPAAPAEAPQVAVTDEPEMSDEMDTDSGAAPSAQASGEIAALDPVMLPPAANDGSTRYGIEIGSVQSRDDLRPLWRELLTKHAALVAGLQPRRVKAPDNTWRLIAGPFADAADAEGACSLFKKADRPCAATVYAGDAL